MENLKSFLKNILSFSLKVKYINILIQEEYLNLFNTMFDESNKYNEYYKEQGKLIINRVYNDFYQPNLFENKLFENLNADQVEIFFGILEYILDSNTKIGVGYAICSQIINHILIQENKEKIILQSRIFKDAEEQFIKKKYEKGLDIDTIIDNYLPTYRENKLKDIQKIDNKLERKFMLNSWYYIDWKKSKN
jgi:hypothetical protein